MRNTVKRKHFSTVFFAFFVCYVIIKVLYLELLTSCRCFSYTFLTISFIRHTQLTQVQPVDLILHSMSQQLLDRLRFGIDIHAAQRMNPNDFGGPQTFPLAPPAGQGYSGQSLENPDFIN